MEISRLGLERAFPQLPYLSTLSGSTKCVRSGRVGKLGQKAEEEDVACLNGDRNMPPEGCLQAGLFAKAQRARAAVRRGRWTRRTRKGSWRAGSARAQPPPACGHRSASAGRLPVPVFSPCRSRPAGRPTYRTCEAGEIQIGLFIIALHLGQPRTGLLPW